MRLTRAKIYALLADNLDGLTAIEIPKALGAKRCTVAAALNKAVDCGRIIRKSPPATMIPYRYRLKPPAVAKDTEARKQYPLPSDYQPVVLPPSLYDAAERQGYDMRWYAKSRLIPSANLMMIGDKS